MSTAPSTYLPEYPPERVTEEKLDANTYFNRGNYYLNRKEYEKAIADFNKAIELDPNYKFHIFQENTEANTT
ncbi:MAG: tetratricopeptide repeat protein [Geminocystis sp. GBBB08]|nr:tetratricopeptide repeat protein [Geminocystis sp. GBBB08]